MEGKTRKAAADRNIDLQVAVADNKMKLVATATHCITVDVECRKQSRARTCKVGS